LILGKKKYKLRKCHIVQAWKVAKSNSTCGLPIVKSAALPYQRSQSIGADWIVQVKTSINLYCLNMPPILWSRRWWGTPHSWRTCHKRFVENFNHNPMASSMQQIMGVLSKQYKNNWKCQSNNLILPENHAEKWDGRPWSSLADLYI